MIQKRTTTCGSDQRAVRNGVDRRHLEDALAGEFERRHLDNDRQGLDNEETADDGKHNLMFDGDAMVPSALQARAIRIAHEDLRGRRVEPKKAQAAPIKAPQTTASSPSREQS